MGPQLYPEGYGPYNSSSRIPPRQAPTPHLCQYLPGRLDWHPTGPRPTGYSRASMPTTHSVTTSSQHEAISRRPGWDPCEVGTQEKHLIHRKTINNPAKPSQTNIKPLEARRRKKKGKGRLIACTPQNPPHKTHLSWQLNCRSLKCSWSNACWRCSSHISIPAPTPGPPRIEQGRPQDETRDTQVLWFHANYTRGITVMKPNLLACQRPHF